MSTNPSGMAVSSGAGPFADLLAGPGFYKLGYVTSDREAALAQLGHRYGVSAWAPFEPALEVVLGDGTTGPARLRCAFSRGRDLVIEVMEPVDGLVEVFGRPPATEGALVAFHHVGVLVDDLDEALRTAEAAGATPVWSADIPTGMRVAYLDVPLLGHHLELVHYGGTSGDFLAGVRSPLPD